MRPLEIQYLRKTITIGPQKILFHLVDAQAHSHVVIGANTCTPIWKGASGKESLFNRECYCGNEVYFAELNQSYYQVVLEEIYEPKNCVENGTY